MFFNHPGFVEANVDRVRDACRSCRPDDVHIAFTAHSIPVAMARNCAYEAQLREAARLVADGGRRRRTGRSSTRAAAARRTCRGSSPTSGSPARRSPSAACGNVVVSPIGFVSDHLEVLFDLDVEARETADALGLAMARAGAAGTHPAFVAGLAT